MTIYSMIELLGMPSRSWYSIGETQGQSNGIDRMSAFKAQTVQIAKKRKESCHLRTHLKDLEKDKVGKASSLEEWLAFKMTG